MRWLLALLQKATIWLSSAETTSSGPRELPVDVWIGIIVGFSNNGRWRVVWAEEQVTAKIR